MKNKITLFLLFCLIFLHFSGTIIGTEKTITENDSTYLEALQRDTWNYIDFYLSPVTGLPCDSNKQSIFTNTTNIGLYLSCLCMAHKLGYIETKDAALRIERILNSLDKFENWNGLYNNWLDIDGNYKVKKGLNNISDYNKLPAGLIMVGEEFPQFSKQVNGFLGKIDWAIFYEPNRNKIYYEYDIVSKITSSPVYISRGEDKILWLFLAVGSKKIPVKIWKDLDEVMDKKYGFEFFMPGWQGGGIFMQYICGLFIDNTATPLGYSAVNFAVAQIAHARKIGSSVWGWSAAEGPDGQYYGWGKIRDEIITPHASVLAIEFFPEQVIENLRNLEKLGVRKPLNINGIDHNFGFRDSINIKTGEISNTYLLLDQAMIFLSLTNFLNNQMVRKTFAKNALVSNAYKLIPEYHPTKTEILNFKSYLNELQIPFVGITVTKNPDKEYFEPGENVELIFNYNNDSNIKRNNCFLEWETIENLSKTTLSSGTLNVSITEKAKSEDIHLLLKIPQDIPRDSEIKIRITLKDSNGKEINFYCENVYLRMHLDLSGTWLFRTGSNPDCTETSIDERDWKKIYVPASWEYEGYKNYNGFACYRKHFIVPKELRESWKNYELELVIGNINDADEVFLNGKQIGWSGSFPPNIVSARGKERKYLIPSELIKYQADNLITVKVFNSDVFGGINKLPILIRPVEE